MQENILGGLHYDTANAYVRISVPSPKFLPLSLPHPAPAAETLKLPGAFLNTSYLDSVV